MSHANVAEYDDELRRMLEIKILMTRSLESLPAPSKKIQIGKNRQKIAKIVKLINVVKIAKIVKNYPN